MSSVNGDLGLIEHEDFHDSAFAARSVQPSPQQIRCANAGKLHELRRT